MAHFLIWKPHLFFLNLHIQNVSEFETLDRYDFRKCVFRLSSSTVITATTESGFYNTIHNII